MYTMGWRIAMTMLDPDGDWKLTYRPLDPADIRWVSESADEAAGEVPQPDDSRPEGRERENRRTVSWIWMIGAGDPDAGEWKDCGGYLQLRFSRPLSLT